MGWLVLALMIASLCGLVGVYAWLVYDLERSRAEWKQYHADLDARIRRMRKWT